MSQIRIKQGLTAVVLICSTILQVPSVSSAGWREGWKALRTAMEQEQPLNGYTPYRGDKVFDLGRLGIATPTRVDIYVTGPAKDIDPFDTHISLARHAPALSLTNEAEIAEFAALQRKSSRPGTMPYNTMVSTGYTYHALVFCNQFVGMSNLLIHISIFEPTSIKTQLWCVAAQSITGSIHYNDEIGPWLHSRLVGTFPPKSDAVGVSTNPLTIDMNPSRKDVGPRREATDSQEISP